jgi:signal transduction histidine kinase
MPDAWDWVEEELKKIQEDIPVDGEMMQVVDAISVADFWKRRYDEEQMLWERKLGTKEEEKKNLEGQARDHESSIKELNWKLRELERKWEQERLLLEDRLKTKEMENALEKARINWETRLQSLEQENVDLKKKLGLSNGVTLVPQEVHLPVQSSSAPVIDENVQKRVEELEQRKKEIELVLEEKEKSLTAEREKWKKLEDEAGQVAGKMSKRLRGLKDREQEHFAILEDLARGFAHRVRNYLGIMSGTIQLSISSYKMEGELEEQLKIVDQNVQEMLVSIEDFLKFARIPEMSIKKLDINSIIDESIRASDAKIRQQNIRVSRALDPSVPMFEGDQMLILEAFNQIIINSIEAMPNGGQITASTSYDKNGEVITVRIEDTGIGISESHVKKVFQPYFSTKKGRKGLGLTTAKRIFNLSKGTLNVESSKDKGTTAVINLFIEPVTVTSDELAR